MSICRDCSFFSLKQLYELPSVSSSLFVGNVISHTYLLLTGGLNISLDKVFSV